MGVLRGKPAADRIKYLRRRIASQRAVINAQRELIARLEGEIRVLRVRLDEEVAR